MAHKEPHWVKLFLRELARTGNVRVSAERAGVDYTSAYQRRKRHGEFAEAWEGALMAYKMAPPPPSAVPLPPSAFHRPGRADGAWKPTSPTAPPQGGAELTAHPDGKLVRVGEGRWSKRAEVAFLTELAVCANVSRAARAAGFSTTTVWKRRLKHAHFAEAWDAAIEAGKAKLEALLVAAAQRRFDPDTLPISDREPDVSVGEAINIVKLKRSEPGRGPGNGGGRTPHVATPEEAEQGLIKRLKVFAARVEKEDLAKGWTMHEGRMIPPGWVRAEEARCARCGEALTSHDNSG